MDYAELFRRLERLLEQSRVGVLTTVDEQGFPRSRWMTPVVLRGRPGYLYALTAPDSPKAAQIREHPRIGWFFQSKTLDEICSAHRDARIIEDAQAKAEVQEAIGPNLQIFWRVNPDSRNFAVIETEILEVSSFFPMRGERHRAARG
jgi:pyridoxamine 5'-phosphate oxidase